MRATISRAQAQHVFDALRTFDETDVGQDLGTVSRTVKALALAIGQPPQRPRGFHVEDADDGKIVIGITGGTGAGRRAFCALGKKGACVLDCDAVYHEMLKR
ncbi:MAG: hypothetical protein ACLRSD_00465 [Oscillibacter sp.]